MVHIVDAKQGGVANAVTRALHTLVQKASSRTELVARRPI